MDSGQMTPGVGLTQQNMATAMARARIRGEKVNLCPFGCQDEDLDANGYCRHLVGFTNNNKAFEPRGVDGVGREVVKGSEPQPVLRSDKLVQITVTSRVYRDVDKVKKE